MMPATEGKQRCLQAVTRIVPASSAVLYQVNQQLEAHHYELLTMTPQVHQCYLDVYREFDPLRPICCHELGLAVVPLSVAATRQEAHRSRRYATFLDTYSICDVIEILTYQAGRPAFGISLLRTRALGAFTAEEIERLTGLQSLLELTLPLAFIHEPCETARLTGLTPREQDIALALKDGLSNKALARHLDMGLPTVKTHLNNLYRKFNVTNRTELIRHLFLCAFSWRPQPSG
ncbi:LuxR C-terminal-related transcriptional regulator [Pseudomonas sp.]|nr:LuxR C-terminal-related transcriptional regulator [Pseudomonas sp.]